MSDIKAEPTLYRGILFRSRLEAKWAILMDFIGIAFRYEPKRFKTEAGYYLPDFWLPDMAVWLELKPSTMSGPSHDECRKAQSVADQERRPCFIVCGFPIKEDGYNEASLFLPNQGPVNFTIQDLLWTISYSDRLMYSAVAISAESRLRWMDSKLIGDEIFKIMAEAGVVDRYAHNDGVQCAPRENGVERIARLEPLRELIVSSANEVFDSILCLKDGAA